MVADRAERPPRRRVLFDAVSSDPAVPDEQAPVPSGARRVLRLGGSVTPEGFAALLKLDQELLMLDASPGGCADLLAGCLFLEPASPWTES